MGIISFNTYFPMSLFNVVQHFSLVKYLILVTQLR